MMSLSDKLELLDKLRGGMSYTASGHEYGVNELTVLVQVISSLIRFV